jgi:FkbM family methyltransferase
MFLKLLPQSLFKIMFYKWDRGHTQLFFDISNQSIRRQKLNDLYIELFGEKRDGLFIEVGVGDGINCGIVLPLADAGWDGFFIEANPGMATQCENNHKNNPKTKTFNLAISDKNGTAVLSGNDFGASIDSFYLEQIKKKGGMGGLGNHNSQQTVTTKTFKDFLEENLPENRQIDVLSVDVEGHEEAVFSTFDFKKYKPKMLCVELCDEHHLFKGLDDLIEREKNLVKTILSHGYTIRHKDEINTIFVSE